jgi:hypothetical protein
MNGRDLGSRYMTAFSTLGAAFFHTMLKSILGALFIWLAFCLGLIVLGVAVMLALSITGHTSAVNALWRQAEMVGHWLVRAVIWSGMLLLVYVLENYVEDWTSTRGNSEMMLASIVINIATIFAIIKLAKVRRRNKQFSQDYMKRLAAEKPQKPPRYSPRIGQGGMTNPEEAVISPSSSPQTAPPAVGPASLMNKPATTLPPSTFSEEVRAIPAAKAEVLPADPSRRHYRGQSPDYSKGWKVEVVRPDGLDSDHAEITPRRYRPPVGASSRLALPGRVIDVEPEIDSKLSAIDS